MLHANLIAGEWVEDGEVAPNINPSNTAEVVGEYARVGTEAVEAACSHSCAPRHRRAPLAPKIARWPAPAEEPVP